MKAVIMAGGRGTRLQPLTDGCPKPMVHFTEHSEAQFSHGLCPECAQEHYRELFTKNSPATQAF